jgi:diguanylate cyclase (GGDEF)-like protein
VLRKEDVAARVGGDEFAVLGVEMDGLIAQALVERLRTVCKAVQVEVSMGLALRNPSASLAIAWQQADTEMYRQKRTKKSIFSQP